MDLHHQFKTDETKEVLGVWVPLSPTAKIRVARMGNPHYRAFMKAKTAPYKMAGLANSIPPEVLEQFVREAVAETILTDWEGITTDGIPIPYTKEQSLLFCAELKDFYNFVLSSADSMETFRVNGMAVMEKN